MTDNPIWIVASLPRTCTGEEIISVVQDTITAKFIRINMRNNRYPEADEMVGFFHIEDYNETCRVGQGSLWRYAHFIVSPGLTDPEINLHASYDFLVVRHYVWPGIDLMPSLESSKDESTMVYAEISSFVENFTRLIHSKTRLI